MRMLQAILLHLSLFLCTAAQENVQKNVLFLVADDLRPSINTFNGPTSDPPMFTPNLDALAGRSLVLQKAYVQQGVCSPSRTSFLTGRRPDTTHVYNLHDYFRDVGGDFTTIPQYFKENGYRSIGMGKIFHPGKASGINDPVSWTDRYYPASNAIHWENKTASWVAVTREDMHEKPLPDAQVTEKAIETLREHAENPRQPFFLAVGFMKPHLPLTIPEEYFDYYPLKEVGLPVNPYAPVKMPNIAWNSYGELMSYGDMKKLNVTGDVNTTIPDYKAREIRRAYYAAVTYIDALIGEILEELSILGLEEDTIITFLGDHGYQLGEHGSWCKHTNFELSTHAPLLISIPGLTDHGIVSEDLVEFVDLFPTLVDATGLPELPVCPEDSSNIPACREGSSLLPLLAPEPRWKDRAFSQYPRGSYMGYSIRTADFRFTEWATFIGAPDYKPNWDDIQSTELYDHRSDSTENWNHAGEPEYAEIEQELRAQLRGGWREAMPDNQ
jgi:iduronate 2-sulfatase